MAVAIVVVFVFDTPDFVVDFFVVRIPNVVAVAVEAVAVVVVALVLVAAVLLVVLLLFGSIPSLEIRFHHFWRAQQVRTE